MLCDDFFNAGSRVICRQKTDPDLRTGLGSRFNHLCAKLCENARACRSGHELTDVKDAIAGQHWWVLRHVITSLRSSRLELLLAEQNVPGFA